MCRRSDVGAAIVLVATLALSAASPASAQAISAASPQSISNARRETTSSAGQAHSRAVQEARFLRSVDPQRSANLVTGDLSFYTGSHVDYRCTVDTIVRPGIILGQCGSEAEPIDMFVRLPTAHLHAGDRLRILGIMEAPASWADVTGHTVYYAFLHAVFVDSIRFESGSSPSS